MDANKPLPAATIASYNRKDPYGTDNGGTNDLKTISYEEQCPGSTCTFDNATWNDDVAQYMKGDMDELLRIRNQAYNAAQPNSDTTLIGRQDSDPKGG